MFTDEYLEAAKKGASGGVFSPLDSFLNFERHAFRSTCSLEDLQGAEIKNLSATIVMVFYDLIGADMASLQYFFLLPDLNILFLDAKVSDQERGGGDFPFTVREFRECSFVSLDPCEVEGFLKGKNINSSTFLKSLEVI